MRPSCGFQPKFYFILSYLLSVHSQLCFPSHIPTKALNRRLYFSGVNLYFKKCLEINCFNLFQISIVCLGLLTMFWVFSLNLCNHVRYVKFNTDLNLLYSVKMNSVPSERVCVYVSFIMLGLLLNECDYDQIMRFITHSNPTFACVFKVVVNHSKIIPRILFYIIPIYLFYIAVTPAACILCISVLQIWCLSFMKITPNWLTILLIILSNDVQLSPGPSPQNFNFMTWNVNSIAKDNFERVGLIESHNSIFNYDLTSLCETSFNDSVELPETLLNNYIRASQQSSKH